MRISEAVSHGQLQLFQHLLTDLEAQGVKTLPEARTIIKSAINTAHANRVTDYYKTRGNARRAAKIKEPEKCPECGIHLQLGGAIESEFGEDSGLVRIGCKKCGYSKIIGGVQ